MLNYYCLFFRTFNKKPLEGQVRIRKHKIIAQAFAKRRDLNHMGRMSISIHSTHDDPVGFNLGDLNSAASNDVSSAWAAAIPKFVTRRGAIVGAAGAFGLRRNSLDSEISMSAVRRISVESRRHSFDSQYSIHSTQQTAAVDLEKLTRLHYRQGGRKRTLLRGRKMALRRRGSVTSQASTTIGSQILPAITKMRTRRGSVTSQVSSTIGSQILPAITMKRGFGRDQQVNVGRVSSGEASKRQDLERIERFSLNLPGDASSDESDVEKGVNTTRQTVAATQSTQTTATWNVATQTSPGLSAMRAIVPSGKAKTQQQSKGTQMTSSSSTSSCTSSPEVVRKSLPKTTTTTATPTTVVPSKYHRERGQADGSPNGSSSEDDLASSGGPKLSSPSQSLLDYLLPVKNQVSEDRHTNGSKNK